MTARGFLPRVPQKPSLQPLKDGSTGSQGLSRLVTASGPPLVTAAPRLACGCVRSSALPWGRVVEKASAATTHDSLLVTSPPQNGRYSAYKGKLVDRTTTIAASQSVTLPARFTRGTSHTSPGPHSLLCGR